MAPGLSLCDELSQDVEERGKWRLTGYVQLHLAQSH